MNAPKYTLSDLGWSNLFQSQLSVEDLEVLTPLRVTEIHRNAMDCMGVDGPARVPMTGQFADHGVAVGDWILIETDSGRPSRVLERKSILKRRAAGTEPSAQLIAANIDTLFIMSSCNADFNPARLERYLALAKQAEVEPVLILTKSDLCDDPFTFIDRARVDLPGLLVETVDATDPAVIEKLAPWCGKGQTLALLGSSGVGKTTLTNALTGLTEATLTIREDDAKGRHTTTKRSMYQIPSGGWLVDTPGMRELRLYDVAEGVEMVFEDVTDLAKGCKFNDCGHETEPGCAVQAAIKAGELNADRLMRWQKLMREDRFNTETVAEHHNRSRNLQRKYKSGKERGDIKRGDYS